MNQSLFNDDQWRTLRHLANRIVPEDEFPNAWDAGVGDFLERLLVLRPDFVETYRHGLNALEWESDYVLGRGFCVITDIERDSLLTDVEFGRIKTYWHVDAGYFFWLAVEQIMEGYYADPGNGGNKDGISWQMIGFKVTA
jgi:hypothetical protein